jgi:hypothetical protein
MKRKSCPTTSCRDPPCKTSNGEDAAKGVVNTAKVTSVEEVNVNATSSKAKSAKLAKLVKEKPIKAAK